MIPDLSISLVSLNRPDLARQCIASIVAHTRSISFEIHLVAHNFTPGGLETLLECWPEIEVHQVGGVRGYSQNNNVALRAARGRYVVILNDDTILGDDLFGQMVSFLDAHPEVVGACPVLRNPDGSLQLGVRGRFTVLGLVAEQLKLDRLVPAQLAVRLGALQRPWAPASESGPVDVEAGTGACFMARRQAFEAIGFLDEVYFLGPDDVDWTIRLRRQVGHVVLLPDLSLTHLGGSTLGGEYHAVMPAVFAGYYTLLRRHRGCLEEWAARLFLGLAWSSGLAIGWLVVWSLTGSPRARTMMRARWSCARWALSAATSPEVFERVDLASRPRA